MDNFRNKAMNDSKYMALISDLMEADVVKQMDNYIHHQKYTRLDHCIHVSYSLFLILNKRNYKYLREVCRGALLHDLFLYDWHTENPNKLKFLHAFNHATCAAKTAESYFGITKIEKNLILTHMFPLCINIPRSIGAWLVVYFDKYCAIKETVFAAY